MLSALYYVGHQIFPSGLNLQMIINLLYKLNCSYRDACLLPIQGDDIFKTSTEMSRDKVCLTKMCH